MSFDLPILAAEASGDGSTDVQARNWLLAQLKPNALDRAQTHVQRQGYACFAPLQRASRRVRGKTVETTRPLFPGYLFVNVGLSQRWTPLRSTYGISRIVSFKPDGAPAPVPTALVEGLQARCDENGIFTKPRHAYEIGDRLQILSGPFSHFVGEVEALPDDGRVYLLMELMGRYARTAVETSNVRKLGPAASSRNHGRK